MCWHSGYDSLPAASLSFMNVLSHTVHTVHDRLTVMLRFTMSCSLGHCKHIVVALITASAAKHAM